MSGEFSTVEWDSKTSSDAVNDARSSSPYEDSAAAEQVADKSDDPAGPSSEGDSTARREIQTETDSIYYNCIVDNPQKEDGQNPYVSYLVTTATNSPAFQRQEVSVRRRFSDFLYLYQSLVGEFAACAIPPLPNKQRMEYIKGDRFGPEFTSRRAASLGRFLMRIARHPALKRSKTFLAFLESNDWNAYKKNKGSRLSTTSNDGVFEGLSDSFLNAFSKVQSPSKELNDVKVRVAKLDENVSNIEKNFARVVRHQSSLVTDIEEFATQTIRLASLEPTLSGEVSEFARGIQEYSQAAGALREQVDAGYITSLRDMDNYVQAVRALIKQQEQKQLDYEALTDYLSKAEVDRNNLQAGGGTNFIRSKVEDIRGVDHERSRQDRLKKLEAKIGDLNKEVANAKLTSESFEDFAINEVQIFERIKALEMKDAFETLCDGHVEFYQSVLDNLQDIAKKITPPEIK